MEVDSSWNKDLQCSLTVRTLFPFYRYRLASGTSEKIQLGSLVSAFQVARDMVLQEAK